jgi:hypothetical protein
VFGQRHQSLAATRGIDPATGQDHRKTRLGQKPRCLLQHLWATSGPGNRLGPGDGDLDIPVEVIAGNIDLGRPPLHGGVVKRPVGQLGNPIRAVNMGLPFGDFGEDRQLLGLLKSTQPGGLGA